jgi:hypothetical protein
MPLQAEDTKRYNTIDVLPIMEKKDTNLQNLFKDNVYGINILPTVTYDEYNALESNPYEQVKLFYELEGKGAKYPYDGPTFKKGDGLNVEVIILGPTSKDLGANGSGTIAAFINNNGNRNVIFCYGSIEGNNKPNFKSLIDKIDTTGRSPVNVGEYYTQNNTFNQQIESIRHGLLTRYPNILFKENERQKKKITESNNSGQLSLKLNAVKWFEFDGPKRDNTNFYLATKKNVAILQTRNGWGNPQAYEKNVLENVILYLSYSNKGSYVDDGPKDKTKPTVKIINETYEKGQVDIYLRPADEGTTYDYRLYEYNKEGAIDTVDDLTGYGTTTYTVASSGLKTFSYMWNSNAKSDGTETSYRKASTNMDLHLAIDVKNEVQYLHVKVEDNNGNTEIYNILIRKDSSAPVAMLNNSTIGSEQIIDEKDIDEMTVSDEAETEEDISFGIMGYGISDSKTEPPKEFKPDKASVNLRELGSGYKWLWIRDNTNNDTKIRIYIHSDLYFKDENGKTVEINHVEFDGKPMSEYYWGDKRIFF